MVTKMKTEGVGFTYFYNDEELKNFDEFEKKIKTKNVVIEVNNLEVRAKDV